MVGCECSTKAIAFRVKSCSHTVWLYHRFTLSLRDVEDLMAERGVIVSYETIRCWCLKFGPQYAKSIRRKQGRLGDIWHVDELFVRIGQAGEFTCGEQLIRMAMFWTFW